MILFILVIGLLAALGVQGAIAIMAWFGAHIVLTIIMILFLL